MILRILILLVAILAHVLTPHWFLKDFLTIGDWMMIFFGLLSLMMYKLAEKDKKILLLSLFLSLSVLIYFVTTAQMLNPDVGVDRMVYRLPIIFNFSVEIPISVGRFIEMFNAVQIAVNTIISILLIKQFYNKKFKKATH